MEKDHEEDKAEYSKVTDAFGQISFQTKFVNGLTELCGERKYFFCPEVTLHLLGDFTGLKETEGYRRIISQGKKSFSRQSGRKKRRHDSSGA